MHGIGRRWGTGPANTLGSVTSGEQLQALRSRLDGLMLRDAARLGRALERPRNLARLAEQVAEAE